MEIFAELIVLAIAIVAAMIVPFFLTVLIGLWEKRMVWPYVPLEEAASTPPAQYIDSTNPYAVSSDAPVLLQPTEKAAKANLAAQSLGFRYLGAYRHGGGALYKVRYDAWVSAEHEVLTLIGGGKLASVPTDNIWLFTQLADGPMLVTITAQAAAEYDLTRLTSEALVKQASFAQAVVAHLERMKQQPAPGLNYSDNPLGDLYQFRRNWSDELERLGYIRFTDSSRNLWRFTLTGAVLFAVRGHLIGAARLVLPTSWTQRPALNRA